MTITIHHLHVSSSERVIWLCEEVGVDYELKTYNRSPLLAPPEYKSLHPAGTSPVIQDGDLTLAETAACIEYIAQKYANGKLFLTPTHPSYADFLYWYHWASGTFTPTVGRAMLVRAGGIPEDNLVAKLGSERFKRGLLALDNQLRDNTWLAGDDFTAADIMVVFPLTTMRYFFGYGFHDHVNIANYLKRVGEREAYQRAMKTGDPDLEPALGLDHPKAFGA
ncbi:uncharacterized protein TRUGW13939_02534 [Talaromyces rugulosus]|uniref:Glutathione S-transferase n=1 Tax=Talaromyces rugulosus TaxID=121627 RepID=A0A7H8QPP1_TALRU|nr:uncharacterized protein TRUGW13939_02534 [Talaromyces rugulosus]QKX55441.1 hypothetical protein TRUGW13939_02534 [Talaromyces rugulosus]